MKKIVLLFALFSAILSAQAQSERIHTIKAVRGEHAVVLSLSDITGREAQARAYEDAKRKALEKVSGSKMTIWEQMEISSAGDVFNSLSLNQIEGEIVEFNIIEEGQKQSEIRPSETIFYCVADVKVKKGREPDPNFFVAVNGIKSIYYSGDELSFDATAYRDCYMKMFIFEDTQKGSIVLPDSRFEKHISLSAGKRWESGKATFSTANNHKIVITKSATEAKEINRLVFVFTKSEMPFNEQITSRPEIEKWIASIPNDQKFLHFAVIEIRDK